MRPALPSAPASAAPAWVVVVGARQQQLARRRVRARRAVRVCRRMAERAAHLLDHVLPDVPVRQWVLTLPYRLRYVVAWRHDLCRAVVRLLHRAIERHLRDWARDHGLADATGGGIALIQRFGGSINVIVHVHALVLDGLFARESTGRLVFHAAPPPSATDVAEILATIVAGAQRLVSREGLEDEGTADPVADAASLFADWAASSVQQGVPDVGGRHRPRRIGTAAAPPTAGPPIECHAQWEGYTLHAGVRIPAGIAIDSSASVATPCAPRSPRSGSRAPPTAMWPCSCAGRGRMAPPPSSSRRPPSSPAWPSWCRARA